MLMNYDPNNPPTCNIVIEKQGDEEKVCGNPVTQLLNLMDAETQTHVIAVVLLCDKHDHDLDDGKSLIAVADDGERIAIGYKLEGGNETDAT
jgi:hypothetical protein